MPFNFPLQASVTLLELPEYESDEFIHRLLDEMVNNATYGLKALYPTQSLTNFYKSVVVHSKSLNDTLDSGVTTFITYTKLKNNNTDDHQSKTKDRKQWNVNYQIGISTLLTSESDRNRVKRQIETLKKHLTAGSHVFSDQLQTPTYSGETYSCKMSQNIATEPFFTDEELNGTLLYTSFVNVNFQIWA